jgi:hypothetical protein
MAESELVQQAAEELYGVAPGEFTSARDARAKELRKRGERDAADAVKELRKPTVAAWALNQLARGRPKDVERLLSAGDELRAAQEELLAGGERSAFQEAASTERELVAQLSADAATLASEAGQRSGSLQEKLAGTLHAAALDEETAAELRAGRLTRERDAIGGFGGVATAAPGRAARTESAPQDAGRGAARAKRAAERGRSKDAAKSARSKGADKRARSKDAAADTAAVEARQRQRLAAARTDERHAQRELDAATRALAHAQERADAAAAHSAEATERARTTAERLKEAKRAEAAARKARARASRALESAERKS